MALKIRITRRAQRDISEIRDYILKHDKRAAERVRLAIVKAVDLLVSHSFIGPPTDEPGIRLKLVSQLPYRIYYRIRHDRLEVLHVRHTARRQPEPGELA